MLALLTRRSICGPASATSALRWFGSDTLPGRATALVSSLVASSSAPAPRASSTRRQPRSSSAWARASPSPLEAPVMIAVGMPRRYGHLGRGRYAQLVLGPVEPHPHGVHRRLRAVGHAELRQ